MAGEEQVSRSSCVPRDVGGLDAYFTDAEELRSLFRAAVTAPEPNRRLLLIQGIGGVGKSSVLRMFRLDCESLSVPVALASADEAGSAVELLSNLMADLEPTGVRLSAVARLLGQHRAVQSEVNSRARNVPRDQSRLAVLAGRTASKTGEVAGGVATGALLGSVFPGIGTVAGSALGGIVGGLGGEAVSDWLRGFLAASDVELLLRPTETLTDAFLKDTAKVAASRRMVLMLDTYERAVGLDEWTCNLARRLHRNTLLVIAGREAVNWDQRWPGWLAQANVQSLDPMEPDVIRELICRYYGTQVGGEPDPSQVEKIVRFSRGLPMAVTTAVRLWDQYGVQDFDEIEAGVLVELVKRLREGVSERTLPVLEASTTVRYFNKEILATVAGRADVGAAYDELLRFPFVMSGREGTSPVLRVHDSVRDFMDRSLAVDEPSRHRDMHGRAAEYFENRASELTVIPGASAEWQRHKTEEAYHRVRADEDGGIDLLSSVFRTCLPYFRFELCWSLLNDAEDARVQHARSIHRLKYLKSRLVAAESSWAYLQEDELQALVDESYVDPETQWEVYYAFATFHAFSSDRRKALEYYQKSLEALRSIQQAESAAGVVVMCAVAGVSREPEATREALFESALAVSQRAGDPYSAYGAYVGLGHLAFDRRDFVRSEDMFRQALETARNAQNDEGVADASNRLVLPFASSLT
jgi:hypothetical protein